MVPDLEPGEAIEFASSYKGSKYPRWYGNLVEISATELVVRPATVESAPGTPVNAIGTSSQLAFERQPAASETDGRMVTVHVQVMVPKDPGVGDEEVAAAVQEVLHAQPDRWGEWWVGSVQVVR
jgi:hypothetical protein